MRRCLAIVAAFRLADFVKGVIAELCTNPFEFDVLPVDPLRVDRGSVSFAEIAHRLTPGSANVHLGRIATDHRMEQTFMGYLIIALHVVRAAR